MIDILEPRILQILITRGRVSLWGLSTLPKDEQQWFYTILEHCQPELVAPSGLAVSIQLRGTPKDPELVIGRWAP